MWFEYKTELVTTNPDRRLVELGNAGWELVAVTNGGFDRDGKHQSLVNTLWLKRPRQFESGDELHQAFEAIPPLEP